MYFSLFPYITHSNRKHQTFSSSNLPIRKLDFSYNAIRRLSDKAFVGIQVIYIFFVLFFCCCPFLPFFHRKIHKHVLLLEIGKDFLLQIFKWLFYNKFCFCLPRLQESLTELRLTDNLLGDSLNPIFSTIEFNVLSNLKVLDLSGNKIKAIEEGILKGCHKLQVNLVNLLREIRLWKFFSTELYLLQMNENIALGHQAIKNSIINQSLWTIYEFLFCTR